MITHGELSSVSVVTPIAGGSFTHWLLNRSMFDQTESFKNYYVGKYAKIYYLGFVESISELQKYQNQMLTT